MIVRTPLLIDGNQTRHGDFSLSARRDSGHWSLLEVGTFSAQVAAAQGAQLMTADAVSPRFTNAHTHLDLSSYPSIHADFPEFVTALVEHRRSHPHARGLQAVADGMKQLVAQRISAVGDIIARNTVLVSELQHSPLAGVAYWEVVCTEQARAPTAMAHLARCVSAWRKLQRQRGPVLGLSPQSPYLVCRDMLQFLARLSIAEGIPLQIHVAESPSEREFFRSGAGALARMLSSGGFRTATSAASLGFKPDLSLTPVRYLAEIGFLDASPTLVHCVNVTDEDIRIIAEHRCPVVTCPRSNMNLNCGVFPWKKFADAGVSIALATDSAASADDLKLDSELNAAFARYGSEFNLAIALKWLTVGGCRALGRLPESIKPGRRLDELMLLNLRSAKL